MIEIPQTVSDDIRHAVESAITLGVSAHDFLCYVTDHWDQTLSDKRRWDGQKLRHAVASVRISKGAE